MYPTRLATHSDFKNITEIWYQASIKAHDFIALDFWKQQKQAMQEQYLPNAENWVLEIVDNQEALIVGFVSLIENKIAALFVLPEYQGHGYGKALLGHAKNLRNELELTVYVKNKSAVEFYLKQGFSIEKTTVDEMTQEQEHTMHYKKQMA